MGLAVVLVVTIAILVVSLPHITKSACPDIISRQDWNATEPKTKKTLAQNPPPYIVVHHSVTPMCNTTENCKLRMKSIQDYHMINEGWEDIGYNFLIGGDGNIYEGRGWGVHGAHAIPYNARSIGVCLIGNFEEYEPLENQLEALKELIACSLEKEKITEDYHVIGHNQAAATLCPGKFLYTDIQKWSHFDANPK